MGPILPQVFASADAEAFDVINAHYSDPRLRAIWPTSEPFDCTPNGGLVAGELQRYAGDPRRTRRPLPDGKLGAVGRYCGCTWRKRVRPS